MSARDEFAADGPDLEALFDSIVEANAAPCATAPDAARAGAGATEDVITQIGRMTRELHDTLRALGHDKSLESAVASMPDARERLAYVVKMTEKAAERALSATEAARPIQDKLAADATRLSGLWGRLYARELSADEFKALAGETRQFLQDVPARTAATSAQLTEVMMAQDFQDLTGQVIKKVTELAHDLEGRLVGLLVESTVPARRDEAGKLLHGPVVNAAGRTDIVANQQQVDELLESLGF